MSQNQPEADKLRVKIAEFAEWTPSPYGMWTRDRAGLRGPFFLTQDLPDYLNDLNAVAEVEKLLNSYQRHKYTILLRGDCASVDAMWTITNATALQRCLALSRVIDQIKEGKA